MTSSIKLDQFLKVIGVTQTGGQAKLMIEAGKVEVNDVVETRRGRKLLPGDHVMVQEKTFNVENLT